MKQLTLSLIIVIFSLSIIPNGFAKDKATPPKKETVKKKATVSKKPAIKKKAAVSKKPAAKKKATVSKKPAVKKKKPHKHYNLFGIKLLEAFPDSFKSFESAKKLILKNYYTPDITDEALNFAAIQGMLRFISPPHKKEHAKLLKPKEFKKLKQKMEGKTVSIGIKTDYNSRDGSLTISEVTPGSPSDGVLETDDRILRIDGAELKNLEAKKAKKLLAGEKDTKVTLTIVRDIKVFDIMLTRKEFKTPNLKLYKLSNKIAVIEIRNMTEGIAKELKENVIKLKKESISKIILDLRSNPGGLFNEGLKLADLFLKDRLITLRIVTHAEQIQKVVSKNKNPLVVELVILVNKNTASSSEILSAALQDHKKAILVGTRTYGKSIIDKVYPLPNKYRVQFTTGSMYGPLGKNWYRKGLKPDIEVKQDISTYNKLKKKEPVDRLQEDKPLLSAYNYLNKKSD